MIPFDPSTDISGRDLESRNIEQLRNESFAADNFANGPLWFWLCVWLGISVAGSLFGLVLAQALERALLDCQFAPALRKERQ